MKHKILGYLFLGIVFAAIVAVVFWWQYGANNSNNGIDSFEECFRSVYGYQKIWVDRCQTPDGRVFMNPQAMDETADWKTFGIGFEIKYPSNWHEKKCISDGYTHLALGDRERLILCDSDAPSNAYVNITVLDKQFWSGSINKEIVAIKSYLINPVVSQMEIDNLKATKIEGQMTDFKGEGIQFAPAGTFMVNVLVSPEGTLYMFNFTDLANTKSSEVFDKILSTFKFTQ